MQPGSVGDRMIALVFDRVLVLALLLIPLAILGNGWTETGLPFTRGWSAILGSLVLLLVLFLYHFILEKTTGTTAGKLIMGLRVVNEGDHEPMAAVALRNILRLVDGLFAYLPGFLVALFDARNRRIGDMVGGTMVIQSRMRSGERAAILVTLIVVIAGSIWLALFFCPDCQGELRKGMRLALERLAARL